MELGGKLLNSIFYPLLLVQGSGQTCVEEFQQVQIACTPFEIGVLQMAWWF
jgi:hypothetical protein